MSFIFVRHLDNDKQTVVKRTGQAPFFAIFENDTIVEFIPNTHGSLHHHKHNGHSHSHEEHTNDHKKDVMALKGCDVILVQMVGENMREALESMNIKIKKVRKKDGEKAQEVVNNFLNDNL